MPPVKLCDLPDPDAAEDSAETVIPLSPSGMRTRAVESDVELELERESMRFGSAMRFKGYRMYLEGKDPKAIAEALAIPGLSIDTVLLWARDGEWAMRLRKKNDARERLVRENVRRQRLARVESAVESSLRISGKIRDKAEVMLDKGDLTPMGLKNIADAAKASGDLDAHGMGEGSSDGPEGVKTMGKVPLVMIFPAGGLPPMPEMKTVEMEEV